MSINLSIFKQHAVAIVVGTFAIALLIAGGLTYSLWGPHLREQWQEWQGRNRSEAARDVGVEPHDEHEHDHAGHEEVSSIELTQTGLKNIDYQPIRISLQEFEKTISTPAMVVERPGRSQIHMTAPLTGVITRIYPIEGAAVEPGSPMFEIRLTHEELVVAQRDFLQTAESLDVVRREIERLRNVTEGVIAGRRILEQEYEEQKLQASLRAEYQALLLHGLTDLQIDSILKTRELLRSLVVDSPDHIHDEASCSEEHLFHVQQLPVKLGQHVQAGDLLGVIADHCELFIEGRAFEGDADHLRRAAEQGWGVNARSVQDAQSDNVLRDLQLLYLSDHVDTDSRAFRFYVRLPNHVVLDRVTPDGRRFVAWRYTPGQRMEVDVPVAHWEKRIVVPVSSVVDEGVESYVYVHNGDHFDRISVHVEYRDRNWAVIANDGSVLPGDVIAGQGAYQIHLALKNRSGGTVDPHAGHNH